MRVVALWLGLVGCTSAPPAMPSCTGDGTFEPGVWQGAAFDVPMTVGRVGSSPRFSIEVEIGGTPLEVFLDTGSSGLRILQGAVPDSSYACATDTADTYSYHSGLELDGVVARATVAIGGVATPAPIPVMYIESRSCAADKPDCGADSDTLFSGFGAVFGIGMRNGANEVGSAIAQLPGVPSFVVRAPAYGGTAGTLTIGPIDETTFATFQLPSSGDDAALANGALAWDDRYGLPACVDDATSGVDYCVPCEWDTGNPPTYIEWPGTTADYVLPTGSQIDVAIGPPEAPLGGYAFTVGATPTPGIDEVEIEPASGSGFMNVGTAMFFHADALFDPATGVIGLGSQPD